MATFQQPGIANPEDKFAPKENLGALLLFFPTEFRAGVKTEHGESDTVAARVVRLNDGRVFDNALIFSVALVTQLKGAVPDGMVLGTLGQGENKKGNAPWLLKPHTEAEVAAAEAWLAANPRIQQAPQAPPTPPAWGAPATPAAPQWGGQAPAAPAPQAGGWGNPPAAPSPQPSAPSWGVPAAPAPAPTVTPAPPAAPATWGAPEGVTGQAPADWQNAGAPAGRPADPGLIAALQAKGVPTPPGMTHEAALGLWAIYGG